MKTIIIRHLQGPGDACPFCPNNFKCRFFEVLSGLFRYPVPGLQNAEGTGIVHLGEDTVVCKHKDMYFNAFDYSEYLVHRNIIMRLTNHDNYLRIFRTVTFSCF